VSAGQVIGKTKIYSDGIYVGEVNLISAEDIKMSRISRLLDFISRVLTSIPAMVIYALILVFGAFYVYYMLVVIPRKQRAAEKRRERQQRLEAAQRLRNRRNGSGTD
jgi:hypothetical protein